VECADCHDPHADTNATPYISDPDPGDSAVPAGLDAEYCLTCHDQQQASDMTSFRSSAHNTPSLSCAPSCHVGSAGVDGNSQAPFGPHGSVYPSLTAYFEESLCANCHNEAAEMSNGGTFTHHHVVDAEQTGGSPLECVTCHDPHLVKNSPWQPLTHPHTGALVTASDVPRESATDPAGASTDTGRFCLTCHDGSWPGAVNIAAELANEDTINSGFFRGAKNLHSRHEDEPNSIDGQMACNYCHNVHGNTGTSGPVRRGSLLYSWIRVDEYPYTRKGSCGTSDALNKCH
jgi:hypothetical protein